MGINAEKSTAGPERQPLPSGVNLLLFFPFAQCNAALEMDVHTVTPGYRGFPASQLLVYPNNDFFKWCFNSSDFQRHLIGGDHSSGLL